MSETPNVSTVTVCEGSIYPRGIVGGLDCSRPARFRVRWGGRDRNYCGIHKNVYVRFGGVESVEEIKP